MRCGANVSDRIYETFYFDMENEVTKSITVNVVDGNMNVRSVYDIGGLVETVEVSYPISGVPKFERLQFVLWIHFEWVPVRWLPFLTVRLNREF